jgi:RND family efflux transporter MFP subunit
VAFDPSVASQAEVKQGDLLFEIDDRPYQIALQAAEAQVADAQAKLQTSSAELVRTEELIKRGAATQADLDRDIGKKLTSEAAVASANAAIAKARLDLEFTKIVAPMTGRISRSLPSQGDLISPASGTLCTIVSVDPVHVYFDMDEPTLLKVQNAIRAGKMKAASESEVRLFLGLQTDDGFPHQGRLDYVENRMDAGTGTIRVRGVFENPTTERGPRVLSPGLFARVRLPLGEPHPAVVVPERAIGRDQGQPFVWIVDDSGDVTFRRVTLGALEGDMRVITEGLSEGASFVSSGLQRVRPGVKVEAAASGG